jgi:hypothetical protein
MDLPTNFQSQSANVVSAHHVCRVAEAEVKRTLSFATESSEITKQKKHLADVRILGYLLSEGSDAARAHIAKSIHSIEPLTDVDKVIELGSFFFKYFIQTCESIHQLAVRDLRG